MWYIPLKAMKYLYNNQIILNSRVEIFGLILEMGTRACTYHGLFFAFKTLLFEQTYIQCIILLWQLLEVRNVYSV